VVRPQVNLAGRHSAPARVAHPADALFRGDGWFSATVVSSASPGMTPVTTVRGRRTADTAAKCAYFSQAMPSLSPSRDLFSRYSAVETYGVPLNARFTPLTVSRVTPALTTPCGYFAFSSAQFL
jgi:hypothetical protein